MLDRRNRSGRPLAGSAWLEAHHRAKIPERRAFAERLAGLKPRRVVDLGCATGLWLELLNEVLPEDCELVGLDSDGETLGEAIGRSASWSRPTRFELVDLEVQPDSIPAADLVLMFNIAPYLPNLDEILLMLATRPGHLAVRQYDGDELRFGPMDSADRHTIEDSLWAAVGQSEQFRHYDLDRVFEAVDRAPFRERDVGFELFTRTGPFPADFIGYYEGSLDWTRDLLSEAATARLDGWWQSRLDRPASATYFFEVDFTAVLSS